MGTLTSRLSAINKRLNGIPRGLFLILCVIACAVAFWFALPYILPFILALLFSMAIEPLVRRLRGAVKSVRVFKRTVDLSRGLPTIVGMLVLFGPIFFLLFILFKQLGTEAVALIKRVPEMIDWLEETIRNLSGSLAGTEGAPGILPPSVMIAINDWLANIETTVQTVTNELISTGGPLAVRVAYGALASVPSVLLFIVLSVMATYQMSSDKMRIQGFIKRTLPEDIARKGRAMYKSIFHALFGQVRAQLCISGLVMLVVILGLTVLRVESSLILGFFIGLADALPVVGAGLFLLPWSVFGFITGDIMLGVGMLILYVLVIITRQIAEPRIVGKTLGLHPLLTMMSMYAGFVALGFLGLLVGPLLANICKVVLTADIQARADAKPGVSADT